MRLLDSSSLSFASFADDRTIPKYAILSHTWGADEILYQDMLSSIDVARKKEGFKKIQYCADQALKEGISYIWVDTCCIDKSSSAELTESINSMFQWYKESLICYAYLTDMSSSSDIKELGTSRWFTRGWTLQELIAPKNVVFYSEEWHVLGSKSSLGPLLNEITGIPESILNGGDLERMCIAERMSWAARRVTTRTEDLAYCLLGIFDINMPMLYGEGAKSFIRLQEEIVKTTEDMSIFCWTDPKATKSTYRGLFARSPAEFENCRGLNLKATEPNLPNNPSQMTNRGLMVEMPLIPAEGDGERICQLAVIQKQEKVKECYIFAKKVGRNSIARVDANRMELRPINSVGRIRNSHVYVPHRHTGVYDSLNINRIGGVILRPPSDWSASVSWDDGDHHLWDKETKALFFHQSDQGIERPHKLFVTLDKNTDATGGVRLEVSTEGLLNTACDPSQTALVKKQSGISIHEIRNGTWTHIPMLQGLSMRTYTALYGNELMAYLELVHSK